MRGVAGLALLAGGVYLVWWLLFNGGVGGQATTNASLGAVAAAGTNLFNTINAGGAGGGGAKTA